MKHFHEIGQAFDLVLKNFEEFSKFLLDSSYLPVLSYQKWDHETKTTCSKDFIDYANSRISKAFHWYGFFITITAQSADGDIVKSVSNMTVKIFDFVEFPIFVAVFYPKSDLPPKCIPKHCFDIRSDDCQYFNPSSEAECKNLPYAYLFLKNYETCGEKEMDHYANNVFTTSCYDVPPAHSQKEIKYLGYAVIVVNKPFCT